MPAFVRAPAPGRALGFAAVGGSVLLPPAHPPASIAPVPDFRAACATASGAASTTCAVLALAAFDRARARESLGPLPLLPTRFARLDAAEQVLALVDLERTSRGLAPLAGLVVSLDGTASSAAAAGVDPHLNAGEPALSGVGPVLNWAGNLAMGTSNVLATTYDFLYVDGPGSANVGCTPLSSAGCWEHRANILGRYPDHSPSCSQGRRIWRLLGVAASAGPRVALGELFVAACGSGPPPLAVSWNAVARYLRGAGPLPARGGTG